MHPSTESTNLPRHQPGDSIQEAPTKLSNLAPTIGLLLVSVIWGTTFVAVKSALADASPLLFVGIRFALATLAGLPLLLLHRKGGDGLRSRVHWSLVFGGLLLGLIQAGAYASQTIGLATTTPSRSAFITGLNVALVPFWAYLLDRRPPGRLPVIGLLLTLPGLWLLTSPEAGSWKSGDTWTVACAVLYGLYLVLLTRFSTRHPAEPLLITQLAATAVCALSASVLFEQPRLELTRELAGAFLLTAVLATTGTVWLQTRLQPRVGSTRAAVIFATEPVFAALFSMILIGERLSATAWAGGSIIIVGMLLSELGTRAPEGPVRRSNAGPTR